MEKKGQNPSGTEYTQGSAISQTQVPEMPMISEPKLELCISNFNRGKSHSEGSNTHIYDTVKAVLVSQPQRMTLLHWCCSNSNLGPSWGQLATPYLHGQFAPPGALWHFGHITISWPFMAPTILHGLRPYPAIIGLPGQFPYPQPPGLYLCFWAWGVSLSPKGVWAP
ncbi:hypothetical protein O181_071832 [Austropuccinia psidii MF-1]|uniref:Uncharacterized protein n=1 Tax=Austropuccinia psidii MF-1 TaxID=1389203 RepID=A0A9Q3F5X8_9BASI|nr:hypothetical protein [Austropuccinia psidii MF-1]